MRKKSKSLIAAILVFTVIQAAVMSTFVIPASADTTVSVSHTGSEVAYTGSWNNHPGGWHESNAANSTASFTFTGTSVKWIANKYPYGGNGDIYIDDVFQQNVSFYSSSTSSSAIIYQKTGLTNTAHTIKLVVKNGWNYLKSIEYTQAPVINDLVIAGFTWRFNSTHPGGYPGCPVQYVITLRNDGNVPTPSYAAGNNDIVALVAGRVLTSNQAIPALQPGTSVDVYINDSGYDEGSYIAKAAADYQNNIAEVNESNNTARTCVDIIDWNKHHSGSVIKDLSITSFTFNGNTSHPSIYPWCGIFYHMTLTNNGNIATPEFPAQNNDVIVTVNGKVLKVDQAIPALQPGESVNLTLTDWDGLPAGTFTAQATADNEGLISESDETNNTASAVVTVTDPNAGH